MLHLVELLYSEGFLTSWLEMVHMWLLTHSGNSYSQGHFDQVPLLWCLLSISLGFYKTKHKLSKRKRSKGCQERGIIPVITSHVRALSAIFYFDNFFFFLF